MIGRVLAYEVLGLRRSLAVPVTALFAVGGAVLGRTLVWLDSFLDSAGLGDYLARGPFPASEVAVPLALLSFVMAAAYAFGRDLSAGDADVLLTAPIRREAILAARLALLAAWVGVLAAASFVADSGMRWLYSLTTVSPGPAATVGTTLAWSAAAFCLLPLVAWAALRFRGVIAATGAAIGLHVVAYTMRGFALGAALPWNVPLELALGPVSLGALLGIGGILVVGTAGCVFELQRIDQG